jgi:hypothetical protein
MRYQASEADRAVLIRGLHQQVPLEHIAIVLDVSVPTLRKYYSIEIEAAGLQRGPKPYQPTDAERVRVRDLAAIGVSYHMIAKVVGLSKATLQTHFGNDLDGGRAEANLKVGSNLLRIATGDPSKPATLKAAIWWSKARMGWRECPNDNRAAESTKPHGTVQVVQPPDNGRDP